MRSQRNKLVTLVTFAFVFLGLMFFGHEKLAPFFVPLVFAHCDTMGGPVIKAAKRALDTGNVDLVLMWVRKEDEDAVRKVFKKTLAVRGLSSEARELADMYFFETLVRVHRAGEGEPYEGLKPEGEVEPAVQAADKALESGSVDHLTKEISDLVASGIRERFDQAVEKKKRADQSIESGREYVRAYVEFVHYVERLHLDASGKAAHGHGETKAQEQRKH